MGNAGRRLAVPRYDDDEMITLRQASEITQTTPDAIRGAIQRERIRGVKVSNTWAVRAGDVYDYIESKQTWLCRGHTR